MVQIGKVRMGVCEPRVPVRMDMWLATIPGGLMGVLVMRVMHVLVFVLDRFVRMLVLVVFGQAQPDAQRHQPCRGPERGAGRFAQHR